MSDRRLNVRLPSSSKFVDCLHDRTLLRVVCDCGHEQSVPRRLSGKGTNCKNCMQWLSVSEPASEDASSAIDVESAAADTGDCPQPVFVEPWRQRFCAAVVDNWPAAAVVLVIAVVYACTDWEQLGRSETRSELKYEGMQIETKLSRLDFQIDALENSVRSTEKHHESIKKDSGIEASTDIVDTSRRSLSELRSRRRGLRDRQAEIERRLLELELPNEGDPGP